MSDAPAAPAQAPWHRYLALVVLAYLFFLAIELLGSGMKLSFADMLRDFLAARFAAAPGGTP